jgi:hypothetical protein
MDDELCMPALAAGISFIRLATPTTDDKRLPQGAENTSGFVYYVSMTGHDRLALPDYVQGWRSRRPHQAAHRPAGLRRLRRQDAEHARLIGASADGVVVGYGDRQPVGQRRSTPRAGPRPRRFRLSPRWSPARCRRAFSAKLGRLSRSRLT